MKTPIEEAIEECKVLKEKATNFRDVAYLDGVISFLQSKLEKEMQTIINIYNDGMLNDFDDYSGIDYFKEKFSNDKV